MLVLGFRSGTIPSWGFDFHLAVKKIKQTLPPFLCRQFAKRKTAALKSNHRNKTAAPFAGLNTEKKACYLNSSSI
jgi:hypothetical protein